MVVMEKDLYRPRLYVGSETASLNGVRARISEYNTGHQLPHYVKKAVDEGYTIVHKRLLCWAPIPAPALHPKVCLLFKELEAVFAYMFWIMKTSEETMAWLVFVSGSVPLWNMMVFVLIVASLKRFSLTSTFPPSNSKP